LLADPPAVANPEQPPSTEAPGATPPSSAPESSPASAAPQPICANCGAPMDGAQDWCLQCGAGAPGSLGTGGPSWRSATTILAATAMLVLGAAIAAYAALNQGGAHRARSVIVTVAQAPAAVIPSTTTPATVTPTPTTPGAVKSTSKASKTLPGVNSLLPTGSTKPPKIPLTASTPKSSGTATTPSSTTNESSPTTTTPSTSNKSGGTTTEQPAAILLDTNAATTYNPYSYPASEFGDPSLAIDGDTSTEWTAQVNPAAAPKMAEGLVIDLKTAQRLSAIELITSTPGMSVQVYGANGHTLPASITDPAWVALSPYLVEPKRHVHIKLRHSAKAFRFVVLWISKAPASSVGTPSEPGHISVNELELFPAK
jgi:hypothetical protein